MAIGSVLELVDFKKETTKIAKKYGGTSIDLNAIADEYNPEKTTRYPKGDLVMYNGDLYRATADVLPKAGVWNGTMWSQVAIYDENVTYYQGRIVSRNGNVWQCVEDNVTGEWDEQKWEDITASFEPYSENGFYTAGLSRCEHDGNYYIADYNYIASGSVGDFNLLYWTPTTIESLIAEGASKYKTVVLVRSNSEITTDANGYLKFTYSGTGTPLSISASNNQPNTGAYFELVSSSYVWNTGQLIIKVTDNTGEPLKNTTLRCYMMPLLTLNYWGPYGDITNVQQVVDE